MLLADNWILRIRWFVLTSLLSALSEFIVYTFIKVKKTMRGLNDLLDKFH